MLDFKLYDCIDKRELLRTPEERQRLLKEIPKVIADIEGEIRDTTCSSEDHEENKGSPHSFIVIIIV